MKAIYIFLLIICGVFIMASPKAYAQAEIPDKTGQPLMTKGYVNLEGSPFFVNDWVNGSVTLANGSSFKNVQLKYNELEDVLYFKNGKNEEFMFAQPVQEFTLQIPKTDGLQQHHFRNGYLAGSNAKAYYEILSDGKAQLLKRSSKVIQEDKEYNSATVTQKIIESIKYYLFIDGKMNPVKKDKKSLFSILGNKTAELDNYIKANNLNIKDDDDLIKLINYYNSLVK